MAKTAMIHPMTTVSCRAPLLRQLAIISSLAFSPTGAVQPYILSGSSRPRAAGDLARGLGPQQGPRIRAAHDVAGHSPSRRIDLPELAVGGARGVEPLAIRTEADAVNRFSIENPQTDPQGGRVDSHQPALANGKQRSTV